LLNNIAHTLRIGIIKKSESKNEKDFKIDEAMKENN